MDRRREATSIELAQEREDEDAAGSALPELPEASTSGRPWYVDEPADSFATASDADREIAARPPPETPAGLPTPIAQLFSDLIGLPHLDPHSVRVIDAQAASDDGVTYTDWVCVATMRAGRERTFRGAADLVKSSVRAMLSRWL